MWAFEIIIIRERQASILILFQSLTKVWLIERLSGYVVLCCTHTVERETCYSLDLPVLNFSDECGFYDTLTES